MNTKMILALVPVLLMTTTVMAAPVVVNGDFETPVVSTPQLWDIYASGTSGLGWTVEWYEGSASYGGQSRPEPALLELHRGVLITAHGGLQNAELDTDWFGPGNNLNNEPASVKITQDVETTTGCGYNLVYWWHPRVNTDNSMNVYVNDVVKDSVSGSTQVWTKGQVYFVADSETTSIGFAETGTPDSLGMFLDDVSVEAIDGDQDGYVCDEDCNDGNAAINPGADDSNCNGIDEDCDGTADDDYVSTPTSCGIGECASLGEMVCVDGQEEDTCTAGTPGTEICDGLDNDCDGTTDEEIADITTDVFGYDNVGECQVQIESCIGGQFQIIQDAVGPTDELCDALDNNCNAEIDEGDVCFWSCITPDDDDITMSEKWVELGTNRWIYDGGGWKTNSPKGKGPKFVPTLEDTHDCSCSQILTWLHANLPDQYGEMNGHWKFGCSQSAIQDFMSLAKEIPYTVGDVGFNSPWGYVTLAFNAYEVLPATGEVNWARITGSTNSWYGHVVGTDVEGNTATFTVRVEDGTPAAILGCDITFEVIDSIPDTVEITAVVNSPGETCGAFGQVQGPWNVDLGNLVVFG